MLERHPRDHVFQGVAENGREANIDFRLPSFFGRLVQRLAGVDLMGRHNNTRARTAKRRLGASASRLDRTGGKDVRC
jgi:hypothetical protein